MFTLKFSTENDAFADDMHGEAARILRKIAGQLEGGDAFGRVYDTNGNNIGAWSIVDGGTSE
jgi:hypothetical protein